MATRSQHECAHLNPVMWACGCGAFPWLDASLVHMGRSPSPLSFYFRGIYLTSPCIHSRHLFDQPISSFGAWTSQA